ncbi:DUF2997 domain-containing protein [Rhodococcus sp. IEGM1300]
MQQVKVTIGKDGNIRMEAEGAVGKECESWTKQLEQILASKAEVKDSGLKPEYHMTKGSNNVTTRS